ncbi:MAG TPA: NblA/ycf18 family protein [Coleofasciculaceae cyanobacterium]
MERLIPELSTEQQFELEMASMQVKQMSHEEVVESLMQVTQLLMIKDNLIKDFMKRSLI